MDKTAGAKITDIQNREFRQLTTGNAEKILLGLDLSDVPFFAKYNEMSLSLAFDGTRKDSVDEIIRKAESGEYAIIEREMKENRAKAYERLLPEIADMLDMSITQLRVSKALTDRLVATYITNWFADRDTIQSKLAQFVDLGYAAVLERESRDIRREFVNTAHERSDKERQADTEHKQAVMQGDKDHKDKEEAMKKEEKHFFFSGRANVVRNLRLFKSAHNRETKVKNEELERQRVKP